mgnify:CR=1 FL=1
MADNVVHQCRCGAKNFVALIANMFVADLLVLLCTGRVGKVVQFQCIVSLKADATSLTQICSLVTVHCLHVTVYVLHPLRLVFTELALQVDGVDRLYSFRVNQDSMPLHMACDEENFHRLVGALGALVEHLLPLFLSVAVFEVFGKTLPV